MMKGRPRLALESDLILFAKALWIRNTTDTLLSWSSSTAATCPALRPAIETGVPT